MGFHVSLGEGTQMDLTRTSRSQTQFLILAGIGEGSKVGAQVHEMR